MTELLIFAIILLFIIAIISVFFLRIRTAMLIIFTAGVSIQYLYKIELGPINAFEIAGMGIPLLLICGLLFSGKSLIDEFNKDSLIKAYFVLLMLLLLSGVLFTGFLYPSHTLAPFIERLTAWFKIVTGFIVLFVASALFKDEKQINKMLTCILLSLIIPGLAFSYQLLTGSTYFNERTGYSFATAYFHHPGVIAYYLLFCFPVCLVKYSQSQSKKEQYFWAFGILILLTLIYFTYRRGVWVGLFVQLFTYFFLLQKIKYKMIYGYVFVIIVIGLSFTRVPATFIDRLSDISTFYYNMPATFETNQYDELFSGRWGYFKANSIYLVRQPVLNFILGNGIGATSYASEEMGEEGGGHNIYLILLVEYGFICLLAYIFLLIVLFRKLTPPATSDPFVHQYWRAIFSLISSYMVVGLVTHVFYQVNANWVFWGLIGAFLGLLKNQKKGFFPDNIPKRGVVA